jgi:hypothetical protein
VVTARYLVASEQMERSGPVAAAVRAAGYASEDEEEDEGSSVEEEDGEGEEEGDEDEELYARAVDHEDGEGVPPSYTQPEKGSRIEIRPNGYIMDKKPHSHPNESQNNNRDVQRRPSKR